MLKQAQYVRYIMWFVCAPALNLMVYVGTGFPLSGAFTSLFMTEVTVVCGLLGALTRTSYKVRQSSINY